jgi:hypothetical protein
VLGHILEQARFRRYRRLSLETGSAAAFDPAQTLYARFGFTYCGPFADYVEDPYSVFMTRLLQRHLHSAPGDSESRHPRESGDPFFPRPIVKMESRFGGNDEDLGLSSC